MKRFLPTWLLLALALAAGQWAVLAHSAEHTSLQAHDGICMLCIQGQNLDDTTATDLLLNETASQPASTFSALHSAVICRSHHRPAIRAPPHAIL